MCKLTLLTASFPVACPELLRLSISGGLIGSTVVCNIGKKLTAAKKCVFSLHTDGEKC